MNSPTWRKAHVATLVNLAVANRYDGLDLDYEGIAFGSSKTIRPALRTGFTALVADISKAMHARGKLSRWRSPPPPPTCPASPRLCTTTPRLDGPQTRFGSWPTTTPGQEVPPERSPRSPGSTAS